MEKTILIEVLRTFSKEEIRNFSDFVSSPFYNKEKVMINLAKYLQQFHSAFKSQELEKEKVFAHLYPGKKYSDGLMRNIISDMLRLAEKFLTTSGLHANAFRQRVLLLEQLKSRKLNNLFLKQKEKASAEIEMSAYKNEHYYDMKTELTLLHERFYRETENTFLQRNKMLQETSDLITISSLIKLLYRNTYMLTVQSNVTNLKYRLSMSREIDSFLKSDGKHYLELPYVKGYWLQFKLIETGDEKYFYLLRDFLTKNQDTINNLEIKNIFTALENYCYKKVTQGIAEFVKEQFLLYKESVENGSYIGISKNISAGFFMSIVVVGFETGEFKWTEEFIEDHISEVKEELRNDTFSFCTALKYYWLMDYENSLSELAKVKSEEFAFKQNIKSLTLKIYFDTNEIEPFYSHIDAYKHFILNNKLVHDNVRKRVNNFINFSKKIFDIKISEIPDKETELSLLKKEISSDNALINKLWLLKKIEEAYQN